jgi:hypothetical protein
VADALWLLAEGAIVSAAIEPGARAALRAKEAAAALLSTRDNSGEPPEPTRYP